MCSYGYGGVDVVVVYVDGNHVVADVCDDVVGVFVGDGDVGVGGVVGIGVGVGVGVGGVVCFVFDNTTVFGVAVLAVFRLLLMRAGITRTVAGVGVVVIVAVAIEHGIVVVGGVCVCGVVGGVVVGLVVGVVVRVVVVVDIGVDGIGVVVGMIMCVVLGCLWCWCRCWCR